MKYLACAGLCALLLGFGVQAQQTAGDSPKPAPKRTSNSYLQTAPYLVAAGDLDGDGRDEVVSWSKDANRLSVLDYSGDAPKVLTATSVDGQPNALAVLDVDGDGKCEVLLGEGLPSQDPADVMKTGIRLRLYRPLEPEDWQPVEIFRGPSGRPDMGDIQLADLDGDKRPEILFRYFVSKYDVDTAVAQPRGHGWAVEQIDSIRMGMNIAAGHLHDGKESYLVVGRPYGDPDRVTDPMTGKVTEKPTVGDAFLLRDGKREPLPVRRGVSSVAVGDFDGSGAPQAAIGDGWHFDYGKMARARLAVVSRRNDEWKYEFIEDVPGFIRVVDLVAVDLDGDGRDELLALIEENTSYAPIVRLYQRTAAGWRGATLATGSHGFAVGRLKGAKGGPQLVLLGAPPKVQPLDLSVMTWDEKLAEARDTQAVDAKALVGKTAPELEIEEWVDTQPQLLADLRGRVVLLDFWATWCGPCIKTFPALAEMLTKHEEQGFSIVGITNHSSQTSADVRKFLAKTPLPWPVGIDRQSRPHLAYGTGGIPHQVLIDRKGVLRAYYVGGEREAEIEAAVEQLLAE